MAEQFANKTQTTLNGAIDSDDTSLVVTSATGFPTSGTFRIFIKGEGANTDEICTVTGVSGTTFTIMRASEAIGGTQVASAHSTGVDVIHVLTAGALSGIFPDPTVATGDIIYRPETTLTNIALNKTSTDHDNRTTNNTLTDGDETTYVWGSHSSGACWGRVDLGAIYTIVAYKAILYNPGTTILLQWSSDDSNWNTIDTQSSLGAVYNITPTAARYWRIYMTNVTNYVGFIEILLYTAPAISPDRLPIGSDNYVLRVATNVPAWEAEFDATPPTTQISGDSAATGSATTAARRDHKHGMPNMLTNPMTNIGDMIYIGSGGLDKALTGSATASGDRYGNTPNKAIDNNDSTYWLGPERPANPQWLKVDLGSSFTISSFRVIQDAQASYLCADYIIESSSNNTDWTTIHTISGASADSGVIFFASPTATRYWRWTATSYGTSDSAKIFTFSLFDAAVTNRLPVGTNNSVLRVSGGIPTWGLLSKYDATDMPTSGDDSGDGYSVGSIWIDITKDDAYICLDATSTAAVWKRITPFNGIQVCVSAQAQVYI
jgi:hypothetical protein